MHKSNLNLNLSTTTSVQGGANKQTLDTKKKQQGRHANFPNFLKSNGSNSGSDSFKIGQEIPDSDNGSSNVRASSYAGKRHTFTGLSRKNIFNNDSEPGQALGGNIPQNMSFGG